MEQCHKATEDAAIETRQVIASLQQELPQNCPLQEQLASLVREFTHDGYKVEWKTTLVSPIILPSDEAEQVLRVVREALMNTRHHSHAKKVIVGLDQGGGQLVLSVQDDGIGFDTASESNSNGGRHFGLSIMHARASRIGGQLIIYSVPGEGTQVKLSWPQKPDPCGDRGMA
jgi:signal transduction histidine kinase